MLNPQLAVASIVFGVMGKTYLSLKIRILLFAGIWAYFAGSVGFAEQTVARQWNEDLLDAIRIDTPAPTVHSRNLFHVSIAMYDSWAAYDPIANGFLFTDKITVQGDIDAARAETISYAAYRVLKARFSALLSPPGHETAQIAFDARMAALGYDLNFTSTTGDSPAALGNLIAETVLEYGLTDGSNEAGVYLDTTGYAPVNESLVFDLPGATLVDINRWQPLAFDYLVLQNGIVVGQATQTFLGPHWGSVKPFALQREDPADLHLWSHIDPGLPPQLGGSGDEQFKQEVLSVIRYSSRVTPDDGVLIDISPSVRGNHVLGSQEDVGYGVNPVTGLPYEPNIVKRGDYGRVLAEFWADGPDSETPPGHMFTIANYVSDHPLLVKKVGGNGPVMGDLEWDVKLYLALGGAVHDSAVGAWGAKAYYDYLRPISSIRYMGGKGQSSNPEGAAYDPLGLPLEPGLVEVIAEETTSTGGKHEHLAGHEGEIAIYAWAGQPEDSETQYSGVDWILAVNWLPYQRDTFVTPPFAGYVSGHSTFSRAAAEVLTHFTGSKYFPGGLGIWEMPKDDFLEFEIGPTEEITLQWATYYDAADESGISRLWGGIHVAVDDFQGRIMGSKIGIAAYDLADKYFNGWDIFNGWPDGENIYVSPWFGSYNTEFFPWIYHQEHGWQFIFESSAKDVVFLWDMGLQEWIFTNAESSRWIYLYGDNPGWLWTFEGNTPQRRFLQRLDDGSIFSVPNGLLAE